MLTRQWPLRRYTLRLSQERNERDLWVRVSSSSAYFFFLINLFFERYGFCFLSRPQWGDANRFVLIQTHEALSRFSPTYELKILEIVFYIKLCGSCIRNLVQEFSYFMSYNHNSSTASSTQDGVRNNLLSNLKTDSEILVIVFSILKNFPMKNSNMNKSNATSVHGKSFQQRHLRRETAV